jgi:thioredoxin 1
MISYRSFLFALIASVALLGSLPASAAEWQPYSASAFAAAQKEGKSILIDIFAPWCPVCRAQAPILEKLTADPQFKSLIVFKVDFDNQTSDVRALKANQQSTLITYKGVAEKGRSVGDTNQKSIAALLNSAL